MLIVEDDLTHPAVVELLRLHLQRMHDHSPPESVFALDLDGLRSPDVTVWTAWDDGSGEGAGDPVKVRPSHALMGCGALRELDAHHGEVKSMRTADAHLRRGVARALLDHLVAEARRRGYRGVSLETGTGDAFEAAHLLYVRAGFEPCAPFGGYTDTTFSRYFHLEL